MKSFYISLPRWSLHGMVACACAALLPLQALSQEERAQDAATEASTEAQRKAPGKVLNYAIGASIASGPDYAGGNGRHTRLRPAWALEYGRFKISASRGGALMGFGLEAIDTGVSATLAESDRFNLRAGLRTDSGRDEGDSPRLAGLPEIRSTLRGKVSVGYAITPRWSLTGGLSQDLLNHGGGSLLESTLSYTFQWRPQTQVSLSAGAGFADGRYMRSYFGVPASAATTSPLPQFVPGAGLYSADAGVDLMHALNHNWVMFGGVRTSQLLGDARRSPLTVQPRAYSVTLGLAYRCCR